MASSEEDLRPARGDRIEVCVPRPSGRRYGTIEYVDRLQVLVRWNDGSSGSLRRGTFEDRFHILPSATRPASHRATRSFAAGEGVTTADGTGPR
jgi:hypothetical protein